MKDVIAREGQLIEAKVAPPCAMTHGWGRMFAPNPHPINGALNRLRSGLTHRGDGCRPEPPTMVFHPEASEELMP